MIEKQIPASFGPSIKEYPHDFKSLTRIRNGLIWRQGSNVLVRHDVAPEAKRTDPSRNRWTEAGVPCDVFLQIARSLGASPVDQRKMFLHSAIKPAPPVEDGCGRRFRCNDRNVFFECRSKANHVSYHLKALHGDAAALCESHYTDLAVFLAVLPDSSEASECI